MNLRQSNRKRIAHAPAKVNLYLDVGDRRGDGFHDVATLMVPVRLCDSLEFEPTAAQNGGPSSIEFSLHGCDSAFGIPADRTNLVVRALELLRQRSGCELGARVRLFKRIPAGAGLGGGSSDAAAALRVANRAWEIYWPVEKLAPLAAELGSDVPFFLEPGAAICRGRGEIVERLQATAPLNMVIIKPPVSLATADVYRALDRLPSEHDDALVDSEQSLAALAAALERGTIRQLGQWMGNRLLAAATTVSPWIARMRAAFSQLDFVGHQLSGSGSAYFGICRHAQQARRLASILRLRQLGFVFVTRSGS